MKDEAGLAAVGSPAGAGLCRLADVAMVQATDFGNRADRAEFWRLDGPSIGGVLGEREVSARAVVVREVRGQDSAQVPFSEDDDMIKTLVPNGADEPLRERICHGDWGAVSTSLMPKPFTRPRNGLP